MSRLALYLFGPPRVEIDGEPLHISRRKAMALLAYLAVTAQPHSRDALATLFWPENDHSSARANLRRMLSSLNRTLGNGWLMADRETVCLEAQNDPSNIRTFWLDVGEFQEKVKIQNSNNHSENKTCPECLPALKEAVALYSDDFMAGFSLTGCREYEEWQFFQAEELRGQLAGALVKLSSHYAETQEFDKAIQYTRRWLALDPLHEPAHQWLMRLYDQSGQRAAALRQYQACREVLREELGVEPSTETVDLYDQIKISTLVSLPETRPRHNLPAQATPFIGRETEVAEIRAKLKVPDCRLLTLLGPGGSGKTRLAIEAASGLVDDFRNGVFFVNLAPLENPGNIPTTIADSINFSFSERGTPEEQLLDYLQNKEVLLVLDNFEHLLEGVDLLNKIHRLGSGLKILVTSRTRLMVTGEFLKEVLGMSYPESVVLEPGATHHYSALRLFESEARRVEEDFKLTIDTLPGVIRICSILEGMPLGIVLAASWLELLNPGEIADEISRDLEFLETDYADLPQRQRSLRSVFNHSWRLLSEKERIFLSALSVFRGGFTREAAQKVAGAPLAELMHLTQKSILHRVANNRFEIHELLRQFAAEKLANDSTVEAETCDKHSDFYCQALQIWERGLGGPQQVEIKKLMTVEIDNIRKAWDWALGHGRFRWLLNGLNGLNIFLSRFRRRIEGVEICHSTLEKLEAFDFSNQSFTGSHLGDISRPVDLMRLKARTLAWCIFQYKALGDFDSAGSIFDVCLNTIEALELAQEDTRFEKALVYQNYPASKANGQFQDFGEAINRAIELFWSLDEPNWVGFLLGIAGARTRSMDKRISMYEQSLAIVSELGDLWWMAHCFSSLGRDYALQGTFEKAETMTNHALETWKKFDDQEGIISTYGILVTILVWQGRFLEAQMLVKNVLAEVANIGTTQSRVAWVQVVSCLPEIFIGEYVSARKMAHQALEMLKGVKRAAVAAWTAVTIDALGRIALAERAFPEAEDCYKQCRKIYQAQFSADDINQALSGLGYAARGLHRVSQAQGYFHQSMKQASETKEFMTLVHTLPGIALLFLDQGEVERAVELFALASTQGIVANSKWFADIAGDEIAAAAEALPAEVAQAARERGRSMDLWGAAVTLLQELEQMGWHTTAVGEG